MFDVDGTLIDSLNFIVTVVNKVCVKHGQSEQSADFIKDGVGLSREKSLRRLFPEVSDVELMQIADEVKEEVSKLRGSGYKDPLFAGTEEILSRLEEQGYLLGIATGNSFPALQEILKLYNMEKRFICLKTADRSPSKPNPAMLIEASKETGVDVTNIVMVGDSVYDMQTAKNAGAKAVGVSWGYNSSSDLQNAGADIIINKFAELDNVLKKLLG